YMKMETVEHFAEIALVTHMLGCQQPLGDRELEKLMIVRTKYQGNKSAAPMPLGAGYGNGNHHDRPRPATTDGNTMPGSRKRVSIASR
ncbi:MAG: Aldolase, partial [Acidobacteriaceae bacterium]|nr:Aldolase [Acidobacteriaceae bacterium]